MALRGGFVLALLLGLGFWTNILGQGGLVLLHMLLGLIVVGALWYLGLAQAQRPGGSLGLTIGTFILGLVLAIFGLTQVRLEAALHTVVAVQITHVILGLLAIGLGEMCNGRIRRAGAPSAV
ncbi:MAG: hypothetical protein PVSMB4_11960 [Ktedonobacterales bacterium]